MSGHTKTVAVGTVERTAGTFAGMVNRLRSSIGPTAFYSMVVGDRLCYVESAYSDGDTVTFTCSYGPDRAENLLAATDLVYVV